MPKRDALGLDSNSSPITTIEFSNERRERMVLNRYSGSRRTVLGGLGALAAWWGLGQKGVRADSGWQFPVVVDVAFDARPILSTLKARGVKTIFRYYAHKDDQWEGKLLDPDEAKQIRDEGFSLAVVYQYHNNVLSNLHEARGRIDATHSLSFGKEKIEQPDNSAVYFGVDGDWPEAQSLGRIREYFSAIQETFADAGSALRVGVYGSGRTCQALTTAGLATLTWLPKSTGWTATAAYYASGAWTLYQHGQNINVDGIKLDTNWLSPGTDDIGAFDWSGSVLTTQPANILDDRRFVKTQTALRTEPTSTSLELVTLRKRQNVALIEEVGDWAGVDLDENGVVDGYCLTSALRDTSSMDG